MPRPVDNFRPVSPSRCILATDHETDLGEVMHLMLKPALRRAWRGRNTVQFGVTRAHAVKLGPVDIATGSFLELLDGTRGLPLLREEARALNLSAPQVDTLVRRLADAGLIDDVRA